MGVTNDYFLNDNELMNVKYFNEEDFLTGKSLYEVIKIKGGVPLFLEKHLERFHNSAKLINVIPWVSDLEIKNSLNVLITENKVTEGSIKFVLNFEKNKFVIFFEEKHFPTEEQYNNGVDVALYNRERINPNAKVLNMEFRRDLDRFIEDKNIFEAILLNKNKDITEGSKSNVFVVVNNKLITPPMEDVLPGTTRRTILEICKELNIDLVEKKINCTDIKNVQGMFISSTPFDILPIKKIDNINLNSSENRLIQSIMKKYNEKVEEYIKINLK